MTLAVPYGALSKPCCAHLESRTYGNPCRIYLRRRRHVPTYMPMPPALASGVRASESGVAADRVVAIACGSARTGAISAISRVTRRRRRCGPALPGFIPALRERLQLKCWGPLTAIAAKMIPFSPPPTVLCPLDQIRQYLLRELAANPIPETGLFGGTFWWRHEGSGMPRAEVRHMSRQMAA
jgi:hypothetical protein